jgi:hypothetical protein
MTLGAKHTGVGHRFSRAGRAAGRGTAKAVTYGVTAIVICQPTS